MHRRRERDPYDERQVREQDGRRRQRAVLVFGQIENPRRQVEQDGANGDHDEPSQNVAEAAGSSQRRLRHDLGDDVRGVPLLRLAAGECPYREQERAVAQQRLRARDPAMNLR